MRCDPQGIAIHNGLEYIVFSPTVLVKACTAATSSATGVVHILGLPTPLSALAIRDDTTNQISSLQLLSQTQTLFSWPGSETAHTLILGKFGQFHSLRPGHADDIFHCRCDVGNGDFGFFKRAAQQENVKGVFHFATFAGINQVFQVTVVVIIIVIIFNVVFVVSSAGTTARFALRSFFGGWLHGRGGTGQCQTTAIGSDGGWR
mmetsp:Transcript_17577/g.38329  ORF Transcript_17577/g.38329 Transcript_17577/m.38329 type:complete len:204 (+) Transcript_17577:340-951(+)